MKKNSKKPEIRRKEQVDIALRLFSERSCEAVSVRDILDEVHGAPGMFCKGTRPPSSQVSRTFP